MIVRVHAGIRVEENKLKRDGSAYAPHISLQLPGQVWAKVFAGTNATLAELRKFAADLASLADKQYVDLDGLRPDNNGSEFVGFLSDIAVGEADEEDLVWARGLKREIERAQNRAMALAKAERLGKAPVGQAPAPEAARAGSLTAGSQTQVTKAAPLKAEDIF